MKGWPVGAERHPSPEGTDSLYPRVLIPFEPSEACSLAEATRIAGGVSIGTVRNWAVLYDIGRKVGGRWLISRVAIAMWLDGDRRTLDSYLRGDRSSREVIRYYDRAGVRVPAGNPG